jgi:hypothetical protein
MDLQRLQPERTAPRRTRCIELMKDCHQFSVMLAAQSTQDRPQTKWNSALLKSVIHIVEKRVFVFSSSIANQTLERDNLKAGRIYCRRSLERGEQGVPSKFRPQFLGNGKGVIPNTIDPSGNSRNDLEERAQTETIGALRYWVGDCCRASALVYSWIVSAAICSQRNCAAIWRHLVESAV